MRRAIRYRLGASIGLVVASLLACEGDGSDGAAPRIDFAPTPDCIRFAGGFPSGFTTLPGGAGEAAVVQFIPTVVLGLSLDSEPPRLLSDSAIPEFPELVCSRCGGLLRVDSDSDGIADACRSDELGFSCLSPVAGSLFALEPTRVALSTSSYEQLLFIDPRDGMLQPVELETPAPGASFDPADWPFWPPSGIPTIRSGLSTRACVYADGLLDSLGDPIGPNRFCSPDRNGFVTRFTAGAARIGDHLLVATSNLIRSSRAQFAPGTLLLFEYDTGSDPPRVRPRADGPILLTSGYNPTTVTPYTTPSGRALALIGVSGSIALGTGPDLVRTDSAIDVVDVAMGRLIATIPLGRAGLGFSPIAIDSNRRVGLIGAATRRALFGIDLAALDDPLLGLGPEALPIRLDGSVSGYPDARLYSGDSPLPLPKRSTGPPDSQCTTQTSVALSQIGPSGVASDFCDGTLSILHLDLPADRTASLDPGTAVTIERLQAVTAPLVDDATGLVRAIDRVVIRPGRPGVDFDGPDVHFTAGLPEGAVCGVRIRNP
ncbi:MAG TPA: hypothetical protein ENI85_05520 [Deltaproteobacteria bacterium]|nr:hypothetical protein [Deltaproteobacteria bacterium]